MNTSPDQCNADSERQVRLSWRIGDKVEIFSNTSQEWFQAELVRIIEDDEGEWLECQYPRSKRELTSKQVQRFSSDVRPVRPSPAVCEDASASEQKQDVDSASLTASEIRRLLQEYEDQKHKEPEYTLALIKPDAFSFAYLIISFLIKSGFRVAERKQVRLTRTRAEAFYAEHKNEDSYEELISFMTSGAIYALKLEKDDAVNSWLARMGSADPSIAKKEDPDSVRGRLGSSIIKNAVHGSASTKAAARELSFFFDCEQTLALVKPDAVAAGKVDEIVALIESVGFTVMERAQMTLTKRRAEEFYAEHKGKDFFDALVAFMTSGELVALRLEKKNAIKAWRELTGPTDFEMAQKHAPRSIRALYGSSTTKNAVHGSDCFRSAVRELSFFFPQQETMAIIRPDGVSAIKTDEIMQRIAAEGFTLLEATRVRPWKLWAEQFNALGKGYMISGTSIVVKLRATNAIAKLRKLTECADTKEATKQRTPDAIKNPSYVDCSESLLCARREQDFFFRTENTSRLSTKQYTLALIKPDAVANEVDQEIMNRIVCEGFVVRNKLRLKLYKDLAEEFYAEHKGRDYYDPLIAFMTSGTVIALKLEREDAVNKWRAVMGSGDFEMVRTQSPRSVRAMFATSVLRNAVHGSDSSESAKRELDFFCFDK